MTTLEELHIKIEQIDEHLRTHKKVTSKELLEGKADQEIVHQEQAAATATAGGAKALGTTPPAPSVLSELVNGEQSILGQAARVLPGGEGAIVETAAPGGAASGLAHKAGETADKAAAEVAEDAVKQVVTWAQEAFGADLVKGLLYVILAGGGAALLIAGISRASGTHPAAAAKRAAKVAGMAAAA